MSSENIRRTGFKVPARYARFVMPLVLSIIMSCVVSAISTLKSLGFSYLVLSVWPAAWALSWVIAFPVLLMVLPLARRITEFLVEAAPGQ